MFDQSTRQELQQFVSKARKLLTDEFTRQLQNDYGLNPTSGEVTDLEAMTYLDDARRATGRILRSICKHYEAQKSSSSSKDLLDRIVREQAFTFLNRLSALRMAEARGLVIESIAQGYESKGFQLYARVAKTGLGETGEAYQCYLLSVFDELAIDLPVLFDRFAPMGRLFPRSAALLELLKLMNAPAIADLWTEDETLGWMYQYFNSKEERKKMRDESAAPRNSRELAVRNQFFTPRYVVEFLTDNTLGRIWYEMTQGATILKDSCQYLVRRPDEVIAERPLKDPREILMLDPACGSMHFGLYAFDLFEQIYSEAWDLELENAQFERSREFKPLAETYESKEAFLRDIPRLIVEYNIHGIDIDPRAVQIAGLSLWLRSQRSWQNQGLKAKERSQIRRSNIVCAEPMPGEQELLEEFIQKHLSNTPEQQLIGQFVQRVFDAMKLAGEAGSLLQIEQDISQDIEDAKQQWLARPKAKQLGLLEPEMQQVELALVVEEIEDQQFWERIEDEIYAALKQYSEQAENGKSYQRRMFVNDAARGFAFIDLCRKSLDVVLMNPPFGEATKGSKRMIELAYPRTKNDVYGAFVERGLRSVRSRGMVGAITSRTGFFLSSFQKWREEVLLKEARPIVFADLGYGVLDAAMVETAAYCLEVTK